MLNEDYVFEDGLLITVRVTVDGILFEGEHPIALRGPQQPCRDDRMSREGATWYVAAKGKAQVKAAPSRSAVRVAAKRG